MITGKQPRVACVLLNWNGGEDTIACLCALRNLAYENVEVLVVDNGSTDNSVSSIRRAEPKVLILETNSNLGFAGGNNVGIRYALERGVDYVWLLNNDTVPDAHALSMLVKKAIENPGIGEVGSVLKYAHAPEKIQAWGGGKINLWTGTAVHAFSAHDDSWFDYLTAASVLLSAAALRDVGLLDEGFFLYCEDSDLSVRLRKKGWMLGVAEQSYVLHKEHASTGRNRRLIDRYAIRSGIRFLSKHAPLPWVSVILFISLRIGKRLVTGQVRRVGDVINGVKDCIFPPPRL